MQRRSCVYHNMKGTKPRKDTLKSLTKFDQDTPKGKKENNENDAWQK